jgi:hypothetical protein
MKRGEFPELARLWQEQIDPAEQAALDTLAREIKRTASRRGAQDVLLTIGGFGALVFALVVFRPSTLPLWLGFAAMAAVMLWYLWKRHRIVQGARALASGEPGTFFAAAVENARAELSLSRFGLWLMPPGYASMIILMTVCDGVTGIGPIARFLFVRNAWMTLGHVALLAVLFAIFMRLDLKLRAQLRRLEQMRREWEEEEVRDRTEAP